MSFLTLNTKGSISLENLLLSKYNNQKKNRLGVLLGRGGFSLPSISANTHCQLIDNGCHRTLIKPDVTLTFNNSSTYSPYRAV